MPTITSTSPYGLFVNVVIFAKQCFHLRKCFFALLNFVSNRLMKRKYSIRNTRFYLSDDTCIKQYRYSESIQIFTVYFSCKFLPMQGILVIQYAIVMLKQVNEYCVIKLIINNDDIPFRPPFCAQLRLVRYLCRDSNLEGTVSRDAGLFCAVSLPLYDVHSRARLSFHILICSSRS
jgi:hypothetical protein